MKDFSDFKLFVDLSRQAIVREIWALDQGKMQIKKEATAVKNLGRIIDATLALANKKGFQAMTLRDLSKKTGMSLGALYNYFSSKDDLVRLVQRHGRLLVERVLMQSMEGIHDPVEKLVAAIRAHIYLTDVLQPWFYFAYMESKNLRREEISAAIENEQWVESVFVDLIEAGIRTNQFSNVDTRLCGASLKALLQDWYLKPWKYRQRKIDAETYAKHVWAILGPYLIQK